MGSYKHKGFLHQEVCNNQPHPSLALPLQFWFGEFQIFGGHDPPVSMTSPAINLSLLPNPAFLFVWPHCASVTRICANMTACKSQIIMQWDETWQRWESEIQASGRRSSALGWSKLALGSAIPLCIHSALQELGPCRHPDLTWISQT